MESKTIFFPRNFVFKWRGGTGQRLEDKMGLRDFIFQQKIVLHVSILMRVAVG